MCLTGDTLVRMADGGTRRIDQLAVGDRVRHNRALTRAGKCDRCPPHDGENRGRRPRGDRHKTARKGR